MPIPRLLQLHVNRVAGGGLRRTIHPTRLPSLACRLLRKLALATWFDSHGMRLTPVILRFNITRFFGERPAITRYYSQPFQEVKRATLTLPPPMPQRLTIIK